MAEGVPSLNMDLDQQNQVDSSLKVAIHHRIDIELPLKVRAHLLLHLVDLLKCEHILTDNTTC